MFLTRIQVGDALSIGRVKVEFQRAEDGIIDVGIHDGGLVVELIGGDAEADTIAFPGRGETLDLLAARS